VTEIILFGGTTEGRELALLLREQGLPALACVATDYGEALLAAGGSLAVHAGRLDQAAMTELLRGEQPRLVIDATHPYAAEAGRNIRAACRAAGIRYVRVGRERLADTGCVRFAGLDALIAWLNACPGTVFSALGAQEAAALARVEGFSERIWLRILPSAEGLAACLAAGFPARHIICMQGPFSQELNEALFRAAGASVLVTKESGRPGGFPEKAAAARKCGMAIAVLGRPYEEQGMTLTELKQSIAEGRLSKACLCWVWAWAPALSRGRACK